MPQRAGSRSLAVVWFLLALAGLVSTWFFNLRFAADPEGMGYVQAWFANPASSSAAMDIIVVAVAACVLFVVESRRLGWSRWSWLLIPLTFAVALAFTFPLFLGLREVSLGRRSRSTEHGTGHGTGHGGGQDLLLGDAGSGG